MRYAGTLKRCASWQGHKMQFNLNGLLIFIAFAALIAMASSNGGTWFHIGEAVATVIILAGVAGLLTRNRSRAH
jgi:hypothetical protein